ncbi:hypothetical protein COT44_05010 [Candidatus Shapirobacteria bacterium CG08_land_8_20_14_0_20_39_18]|uniref:Uncharacterized protein n=1 Tax=Candidatus Shapirobacteria bacterium CG08_land_8_20_14_0_20_39_18 TaxID=1974883 RepID=A0A2M6XBU9_9BACT|nr:MAG: hypothetical protein COT44_05010 [Candidatus Shapirobacteria bacterium CG08_land_8_20_14_0_20_39_18]PIY64896.1 MAG: hypothetical protein COY91_04055 [Candidatus Shapirobacteria bacterium CG_4_10_14_0_8_um_filter_39_15]PJE68453.1 MAG: hypothetical protein COU94_01790 [Candidatus Shapirobacteria bacterium CG10_big_fil_rev_8_21_14_0_10_38_8]
MIKNNDIATKTFVQITIDTAINRLRDELLERIKQSEDKTLTRLDKILGIVNKQDEDRVITAYRQTEHTDQLENHENRIKSLKTRTTSNL